MKKLLAIIVLSLCFITPSQAEDISDFQIEGVNIGDSLLDHYNKTEINAQLKKAYSTYTSKKIIRNEFIIKGNSVYDRIKVHYRNDGTYKIVEVAGLIMYRNNNIDECYAKKNEIAKDLSILFPSAKQEKARWKYSKDQKSIFDRIQFKLNSGDIIILC
ncbi:hypothetical protein N9S62_04890 [Pelagibacteraceae bacterium]|nr:hypothetical protein [Pelagibacteraceae bacterium]